MSGPCITSRHSVFRVAILWLEEVNWKNHSQRRLTMSVTMPHVPRNYQNTLWWWCLICQAINALQCPEYFRIFSLQVILIVLFANYCGLFWILSSSEVKATFLTNKFRTSYTCTLCVYKSIGELHIENWFIYRVSLQRIRDRGEWYKDFYWHLLETRSITHSSRFMRLCGSPMLMLIKQSPSRSIW